MSLKSFTDLGGEGGGEIIFTGHVKLFIIIIIWFQIALSWIQKTPSYGTKVLETIRIVFIFALFKIKKGVQRSGTP